MNFRLAQRAWFRLAILWLTLPVSTGLTWIGTCIFGGLDWRRDFELFIKRNFIPDSLNPVNATAWFWIIMCVLSLLSIWIMAYARDHDSGGRSDDAPMHSFLAILTALSMFATIAGFSDNPKDEGRYYNASTTFFSPSLELEKAPGSATDLVEGASAGNGDCEKVTRHDVPSCLKQGNMPAFTWEPRVASLTGATRFLSKKSGGKSGVNLMRESVTYLYNQKGPGGKWTGIRDGSGSGVPIYGVVEWDGQGNPTECLFNRGGYNLHRAFNGEKGNSLVNLLAEQFRPYLWDANDVWGYCDAGKPVVVIPMTQEVQFNARTVRTAAGVVVMYGSSSGDPDFVYHDSTAADELPGPAYPASLVAHQRDMLQWAAGERIRNGSYGYKPSDDDSQKGNNAEYLMREVRKDGKPGRTFWMTPLIPKGDSTKFAAYSLTLANQVTFGSLNRERVYVLGENDPRNLDLNDLDTTVTEVINAVNPALLSNKNNPGRIVEYLPLNSNEWQVYVERNSVPLYVITIPVSIGRLRPTIASISPQDGKVQTAQTVRLDIPGQQPPSDEAPPQADQPAPPAGSVDCGKAVNQMSEADLASCIGQMATEQQRRHPR